MTTCNPKRPLRCWQYTCHADSIPMWVVPYVLHDDGVLKLKAGNDDDWDKADTVEENSWLIEFPAGNQLLALTDREFSQHYGLTPEAG